ncbi:MAG: ABC transporter permease [Thermomicrobiales bacterium]|nr:ABC transporter permease [Thermomicrobiales bacterium]
MARTIAYRGFYAVLLLVASSFIVFYGMRLAPGDVADVIASHPTGQLTVERVREDLGLNNPLLVQYAHYMGDLLTGDLGISLITGEPIAEILRTSSIYTLKLAALAALLSIGLAIPLGILAAAKRNSLFDQATMLVAVIGMGIPNFFLAVLLIQLFTVRLGWLPVAGYETPKHIIMPALVLAAEALAINLRVVRSSALEELSRDYVRTLKAKGMTNSRILWVHVLRNSLPPVIALAGIMMRTLLGYTLIVETIFRWPGLGYQLVNAVLKRDYTLAQTLAILLTAAVILFNTIADLLQQWADPRTRGGSGH